LTRLICKGSSGFSLDTLTLKEPLSFATFPMFKKLSQNSSHCNTPEKTAFPQCNLVLATLAYQYSHKDFSQHGHQWLLPVIPAPREAEIRRIMVRGHCGQKARTYLKNTQHT
jgi:hypothetical protein